MACAKSKKSDYLVVSDHNLIHIYRISLVIRQSFFFPTKNNPRHLDPSYKMDLDLWDCLGSVKLKIANFDGTDLVICSYFREGKPHLIAG